MTVRFYIDEDEVQKAAQRMNEPMSTEDAERFLDRNEAFLLREPLNKSSAAEQRSFSASTAV